MSEQERPMRSVSDWPDWIDPSLDTWPTTHLPDDAVDHPFLLAIDSQQVIDSPREGGCWFTLNFDGRKNPGDLTPGEKAYILGMIQGCLDGLPGKPYPEVDNANR